MCLVLGWNLTLEISTVDNLSDKFVEGLPEPGYGYMFMNKISMSQTCMYNFFYKKATRFIQQPLATEGIQL